MSWDHNQPESQLGQFSFDILSRCISHASQDVSCSKKTFKFCKPACAWTPAADIKIEKLILSLYPSHSCQSQTQTHSNVKNVISNTSGSPLQKCTEQKHPAQHCQNPLKGAEYRKGGNIRSVEKPQALYRKQPAEVKVSLDAKIHYLSWKLNQKMWTS